MNYEYDLAVCIGRWEPPHNGHMRNLRKACDIAQRVLVIVGSANQPATIKNPFSASARVNLMRQTLAEELGISLAEVDLKFIFAPANDYLYEDTRWLEETQAIISGVAAQMVAAESPKVCILGHDKDESTYYMKMFPNYSVYDTGEYTEVGELPINATHIRTMLFEKHLTSLKGLVPPTVYRYLLDFAKTPAYQVLVEEYEHIRDYKASWQAAPYPVTFNTVDAVVVQGGHVLLVKRKYAPGRGLWALPGGFLNQDETSEQGAIRELREETGLKVPEIILRKAITFRQRFDHPKRSLRGRTITEAFLIELEGPENGALPKVKGRDDAEVAKFFPIAEVRGMSAQMFEDHYSIVSMMLARAK